LGCSALLSSVFNRSDGDAPSVDLDEERRNGQFILENRELIKACSDLSDGGLALAAFEMAHAAGTGLYIQSDDMAYLFGEDQARYLIACNFDQAEALMIAAGQAGVTLSSIGRFEGNQLRFGSAQADLSELSELYTSSFGTFFD
jgi:phosphoribosylformylglycinamidine synthase